MTTSIGFDIFARDRASATFDKVGNSIDATETKTSKLGAGFAKFGKLAAVGIAAGGAAAIVGARHFIGLGAELEQMGMKADTVFGGQVGKVESWAAANSAAMGLTGRQAVGLAANFGDLLIPMGFTRKQAAGMSTEVVGLSGALSQWSGGTISAAEASDVLAKAMLGERDGLKALGISISDADVKARLLKNGQNELTGSALQQATAMATQQLIMEKSTDAQAAYAAGGAPLLSAQAQLKAKFGEVQELIALKLVPAFTAMATMILDTAIPSVQRFVAQWQEGVGAGGRFAAVFGAIQAAVTGTASFLMEHKSIVVGMIAAYAAFKVAQLGMAAASAVSLIALKAQTAGTVTHRVVSIAAAAGTGVLTAAQWALNVAMRANPIGIVLTLLSALGVGLAIAWRKSAEFREVVTGAWEAVKRSTGAVFEFVRDKISATVASIVGAWVNARERTAEIWQGLADVVGTKIASVMEKVASIRDKVTGFFAGASGWLASAGSELIQGLINGITSKLAALSAKMAEVANKVKGFLPGSPVKTGPLTSWNNGGAGKRLVGLLADGLSDTRPVDSAMRSLSGAIGGDLTANAGITASGSGSTGSSLAASGSGSVTYQFNIYDATDPNAVVAAIQQYVKRNGPVRGLTAV